MQKKGIARALAIASVTLTLVAAVCQFWLPMYFYAQSDVLAWAWFLGSGLSVGFGLSIRKDYPRTGITCTALGVIMLLFGLLGPALMPARESVNWGEGPILPHLKRETLDGR